ncbi:MAG: hypothetical protein CMJ48_01545 [Planctomycetaceae bacterium]|nr:hypothetical protein [Planctomycetaceae bacterium]
MWKELRETWWMGMVALVLFAIGIADVVNLGFNWVTMSLETSFRGSLPFDGRNQFAFGYFLPIAAGMAIVLGLWQSLMEFVRGTWHFLINRPIERSRLVGNKLVAGLLLYFVTTAIPILGLACWAATPGAFAAPFEWSLTRTIWLVWLVMPILYLGAFLCGIRQARWWGTRLLPFVAAAGIAILPTLAYELRLDRLEQLTSATFVQTATNVLLGLVLLADALFVAAILHTSQTRNFS